jgi:kinesin family protein 6/9
LKIEEDARGGVVIKNARMVICDTEEDALNCLFEGELARTVAAHQLNNRSSRSHTVFTVHIESRSRVESTDKVITSKLHLVDLAGSERTKKTGSSGLTLKEATFINKSLSFLEQVVIALSSNHRDHIPYRQSRLTNLLRDSLGGNCKTVMIANIWPEASHLEETISTLKFATRMMRVSNEAIVNVTLDKHLMIKRYEKEIRDLKQELAMHDTLKNRGRITYDQYTPDQLGDIKQLAASFLAGETDEITDFDSLRKVREYFAQIRGIYRKLKQNVEAMQRQLETDPAAAAKLISNSALSQQPPGSDKEPVSSNEEEKEGKKKRTPLDKQTAFVEYKTQSEEGKALEKSIIQYREEVK